MSVFEYNEVSGKPLSLALGNFDGIHIGHAAILRAAKGFSEKTGADAAVLLFDEHPKRLLSGEAPAALMSSEARDESLEKMGFKLIRARFSEIMNMEAEEFFSLLCGEFEIKAVSCGFNFRFGKGGEGGIETLKKECEKRNIELLVSKPVTLDGEVVSSTKIRRLLSEGNIRRANKMLGRPFSFSGKVIDGDKRGRLLGFPTANQALPDGLVRPKRGVYASAARVDGVLYPAATNIGIRPTFGLKTLLSETNIIGFNGDIYGKNLEVSLLDHMRDETDCLNAENLMAQLKKDIKEAETIFKKEFTDNGNT